MVLKIPLSPYLIHQHIYSIQIPDISIGEYYSDLYLRDVVTGAERQMTFTPEKNEAAPAWHSDGTFFAFISNRSGNNQVYFMHPDGGEARAVTDADDGVGNFAFSRDGSLYLLLVAYLVLVMVLLIYLRLFQVVLLNGL